MTGFIDAFAHFIGASPSSFHAADQAARQLETAGWSRGALESGAISAERGFVVRDGAIVAWQQSAGVRPDAPYRIVGTHTDSPGFVVKPSPSFAASGYAEVGVEVYGGPILASWFDRELELAGRLVTHDGSVHLVRSGPALRIPHLAIHLDRDINAALKIDTQRHVQPVWAAGDAGDIIASLAEAAGVAAGEVAGWDLITVPTEAPARFGRSGELFASPRLD
ncbi:MAG TPA: M18 family aminopeptidase, partial [Microbacteriaceae bacterium]|nr:M18 family aminopeptidase [Microbacteriaceae bacterium]